MSDESNDVVREEDYVFVDNGELEQRCIVKHIQGMDSVLLGTTTDTTITVMPTDRMGNMDGKLTTIDVSEIDTKLD